MCPKTFTCVAHHVHFRQIVFALSQASGLTFQKRSGAERPTGARSVLAFDWSSHLHFDFCKLIWLLPVQIEGKKQDWQQET